MKRLLLLSVLLLAGLYYFAAYTAPGQNLLLARGTEAAAGAVRPLEDGLNVFVCGSAAPLPAPDRAQGCIAVLTPEHYFVVDAGSGSANNLGLERLPAERLDGVLLTHFHSDHIVDIPSINVVAWASGNPQSLQVYGPVGVERVVAGFNTAFVHDRAYRSEHHGATFMPPELGVIEAVERPLESQLSLGALTITSFAVDHSPVAPAVGYRFDYKGRSVVITGDTIVTERLRAVAENADLLLSDGMSLPIVRALNKATAANGNDRLAKILVDIQSYHAPIADVAELAESAGVRMTGIYHLVPGPRNRIMENIFKREFSGNMRLTRDRMWFELPANSTAIKVID